MSQTHREKLATKFREFLALENVIDQPTSLNAYECDGLSAYRQQPLLVLLPENIEQVQQVMRVCHAQRLPVVSRGAGTSLSGGALPHAEGVVLSLAKMNRILRIDPLSRLAVVEPGVPNLAISEAVKSQGLYYAPDPSSQIACSIGGNVAENAGGVHCLKYGLTLHNILALKVVSAEGDIFEIDQRSLQVDGYDLLPLLVGSEGMLGIVVEVTVKLLPIPRCARVVMGVFDSVEKAGDSVAAIIAEGIIPAGIEMMDNPAIRAAEDFVHAGYPIEAEAILICELDGTEEEVLSQIELVENVLKQGGATETRLARDEAERLLFWSGRKAAFPAVGRISPDYYCIDGTIPRKALSAVLAGVRQLSEEYGLAVANVFHAGDGNLHPLILYDGNNEGELEKTEELGSKILQLCIHHGGTITGEHGVGVEKLGEMCVQFSETEREQFHAIRECFDPLKILNPGKAIPTLARCAEFNAMHVHKGKLPFPELDRF
ncbi:MAG: FAD-binding protein [Gammaproteobacteria bacterium]|nr:FAD-binding protein [Gammaproteobacteria bacterium]